MDAVHVLYFFLTVNEFHKKTKTNNVLLRLPNPVYGTQPQVRQKK